MLAAEPFGGYRVRRDAGIPVAYPPHLHGEAAALCGLLDRGARRLSELFGAATPGVEALLVPEGDWHEAPRDGGRPYPYGLPYFTRATRPPTLVLPSTLAPAFGPRTEALLPLTVWHELAHAFLLDREVVRTPPWLGEWVPQAASAAVARAEGLPLDGHLALVDPEPGFTVRTFGGWASAGEQMKFQNLLLVLADAAVGRFGDASLARLVRALWRERDVVDEGRAVRLLADALGTGGQEWLSSRTEF